MKPARKTIKNKQSKTAILEYAKKENLKSWGLSLLFFFITIFVIFGAIYWLFGISFWWPLILLGGLGIATLVGYVIAPISLSRSGVKEYKNPPPGLVKMLNELSRRSRFKKPPKLMFCDTPEANAVTYRSILGGRIIVTRGLVDLHQKGKITNKEMGSIFAHELGHLKFFHVLKSSLTLSWASFFYYLGIAMIGMGMITTFASRASRGEESLSGMFMGALIGMIGTILFLISIIAKAIGFVNLRQHEYEADAYSVVATGNIQLASALQKIEKHNLALAKEAAKRLPNGDSWTVRPRAESWIERLFDTHPATKSRIDRLLELE